MHKNMTTKQLKHLYLQFFKSKGHTIIPSASLIPDNDPTVLFTTAGMHPLVPYLLGEPHPAGKRLCDAQKCIRTGDIDTVGDRVHHTFFEMLGNWSLGDYFKEDAITYSFEFLTSKEYLNLPLSRLAFTCFIGDDDCPKDMESFKIWRALGVREERIAFLPKEDNWWGPAGQTGPCGPDTEMFYWSSNEPAPDAYDPKDKRWVEIWNDVFMQYTKNHEGTFVLATQQNVDTGLGVERVTAILNGYDDNYRTDAFWPIIEELERISNKRYDEHNNSMRIIADHMRAAVFILGDTRGITPSNVDQGYVLRRLIRRSIRHAHQLGIAIESDFAGRIAKIIIHQFKEEYEELANNEQHIIEELRKENDRFSRTLDKGLREFNKMAEQARADDTNTINGENAFLLFQSFGFPLEMTRELASELEVVIDEKEFAKHFEHHQELSRVGAEKKFKGGLADDSDTTRKLHTATHLLNEALRQVISPDIKQKGSNITPERLRFDFNFERKLTPDEIKKVEDLVNQKISESIDVKREEMSFEDAKRLGAQAEFGAKYGERVSVYSVGDFSIELCGGPHVTNTKEIGHFKIIKEESSAANVRRIKAIVE